MHIREHRGGFNDGFTEITSTGDDTGIALGVHKFKGGERYVDTAKSETAWLLMNGRVSIEFGGEVYEFQRRSLFDDLPICLHVSAGTEVRLTINEDSEFTVYQTANAANFSPRLYRDDDVESEDRGKGQVGDTCWRVVRTIFGIDNRDSASELVLGEVITLPGRWSSYPPHHHAQPEIYHYRFNEPQGYGHGELGDSVLKVRQYDTVKILDLNDHAQCAAPGYAMYYSWVIRHLPDQPYTAPEFTEEHTWVMKSDATFWQLK
jgi:5-deoxy-glucuronate isomerase